MSRHLFIIRHAKSSWSKPNMADIDRPLNDRGFRDVKRVGPWLNRYCKQNKLKNLHFLVSPATRTRMTLEHMAPFLKDVSHVEQVERDLYLAEDKQLVELVHAQIDSIEALAIVGHNPGLHGLVQLMSGQEIDKFPTCAIACLEFDSASWHDATAASCVNFELVRPKQLDD
jgi:phosphohistidine phosphatase